MTVSISKQIRALIGPHHISYLSSSRGKQFSSVTCTVVHDRRWSWEQPTCISEIMLKLCENVTASHLAWKQPWIISLSNDLFSHQTQCLLSPGCFIATIRDRWGKHKQFSWIERQWISLQQLLDRFATCTLKSHPKVRHCSHTSIWPTGRISCALSDMCSSYHLYTSITYPVHLSPS